MEGVGPDFLLGPLLCLIGGEMDREDIAFLLVPVYLMSLAILIGGIVAIVVGSWGPLLCGLVVAGGLLLLVGFPVALAFWVDRG